MAHAYPGMNNYRYRGYSGCTGFTGMSGFSGMTGYSGFSGFSGLSGYPGETLWSEFDKTFEQFDKTFKEFDKVFADKPTENISENIDKILYDVSRPVFKFKPPRIKIPKKLYLLLIPVFMGLGTIILLRIIEKIAIK